MRDMVFAAAKRIGGLELVELMEETGVCGGKPVGFGDWGEDVVEAVPSEEPLLRRSGVSGGVKGNVPPWTVGADVKTLDGVEGVGGANWMGGGEEADGGR